MIHFHYPFNAPTLDLDVKDPELQDKQDVLVHVRIMTAMNGSVRTSRTTPANIRLVLTFRDVTRNKALEIRDFLLTSEGTPVRYDDFKGQSWKGYLVTDPTDITTYARGLGNAEPRPEANELTLTFEGTLLG